MDSIAGEFPDMSDHEVFGRSVWAGNAKDLYRGFSPLQHAAGRTPDEDMRLFETNEEKPVNNDLVGDGGFGQNMQAMCLAEKAFIDEQAKQRIQRAKALGQRKLQHLVPGDLVHYWRKQQAGKEHQNFPKGRFLGPVRALATETRREEGGQLRPGSSVWIHRAGRLLRASPEQLRHASPRELWIEELRGPTELPWTITSLASDPKKRTFLDISQEVPPEDERHAAAEKREPGTLPIGPQQAPKERKAPHSSGGSLGGSSKCNGGGQ